MDDFHNRVFNGCHEVLEARRRRVRRCSFILAVATRKLAQKVRAHRCLQKKPRLLRQFKKLNKRLMLVSVRFQVQEIDQVVRYYGEARMHTIVVRTAQSLSAVLNSIVMARVCALHVPNFILPLERALCFG